MAAVFAFPHFLLLESAFAMTIKRFHFRAADGGKSANLLPHKAPRMWNLRKRWKMSKWDGLNSFSSTCVFGTIPLAQT